MFDETTQNLHGTSRDKLDFFQQDIDIYSKALIHLFTTLGIPLNGIKEVLDGGCGYGVSTLALSRCFKDAQIWAVSVDDMPVEDVGREIGGRYHFQESKFVDFLMSEEHIFDIIHLSQVPRHGVVTPEDYEIMARRVNKGGYVIISLETGFDRNLMNKHFTSIDVPSSTDLYGLCKVWRKPL